MTSVISPFQSTQSFEPTPHRGGKTVRFNLANTYFEHPRPDFDFDAETSDSEDALDEMIFPIADIFQDTEVLCEPMTCGEVRETWEWSLPAPVDASETAGVREMRATQSKKRLCEKKRAADDAGFCDLDISPRKLFPEIIDCFADR